MYLKYRLLKQRILCIILFLRIFTMCFLLGEGTRKSKNNLGNIFIGRWRRLPDSERVLRVVLTSSMLATALAPRDWIKLLDISLEQQKKTKCTALSIGIVCQKYTSSE